ncbi:MAG: glycosyltransferase [Chloroflexia bacterium]|nr:glycosyltransferase [Chloroflexia bacterium]
MKNISAVLITKNAEATINLTLNSLLEFSEVIVLDTGSSDQTMEICKRFKNVEIYQTGFLGFGEAKNNAAQLAKNDWILSIDADEVISKRLLESIKMKLCRQIQYISGGELIIIEKNGSIILDGVKNMLQGSIIKNKPLLTKNLFMNRWRQRMLK